MKFDKRVQPGARQKTEEEIKAEMEKQKAEMIKLRSDRMKDPEEENQPDESVEIILQKKEEIKEAEPLAYSMTDGTLLNHREELSEALRNIKKTDSDESDEESDDGDENEQFDDRKRVF